MALKSVEILSRGFLYHICLEIHPEQVNMTVFCGIMWNPKECLSNCCKSFLWQSFMGKMCGGLVRWNSSLASQITSFCPRNEIESSFAFLFNNHRWIPTKNPGKPDTDVKKDEKDMVSVLKAVTFEGKKEKNVSEGQLNILHTMEESLSSKGIWDPFVEGVATVSNYER